MAWIPHFAVCALVPSAGFVVAFGVVLGVEEIAGFLPLSELPWAAPLGWCPSPRGRGICFRPSLLFTYGALLGGPGGCCGL